MKKNNAAKIKPLLALLAITACAGGSEPIDAQKQLAAMDGPKVATMDETLLISAKNAEDKGKFGQAATYYQQLLAKKPDDSVFAFALAESYRRNGESDKAIMLYDQLIAKDPAMIAAKESKGLALIAKGDFKSSTPLFEEVLKTDPTRWKSLNALGILFSIGSFQPEAQQYFTEALKYHPDSSSIYNNLGLSQALNRDFDAALASLQKASNFAVAATEERKRIDLNLALVYASAGKLDNAKAIAENYLTGAALDNNLGLYAHVARDDLMARSYLNMALMESKVYYGKAWDNLQNISSNGNDNGVAGAIKVTPAAPAVVPPASVPIEAPPSNTVPADAIIRAPIVTAPPPVEAAPPAAATPPAAITPSDNVPAVIPPSE